MLGKLKIFILTLSFLAQSGSFAFSSDGIHVKDGVHSKTANYSVTDNKSLETLDIEETNTDESFNSLLLQQDAALYSNHSLFVIRRLGHPMNPENLVSGQDLHVLYCTFSI